VRAVSLLAAALIPVLALEPHAAPVPPADKLRVGLAEVGITPTLDGKPVYLAGFGHNRKATGVHDPLFARAVVFQEGEKKLALVCLDVVGFFHPHVLNVRKQLPDFHYVMVSSTHNHEGPDTLGLWGPNAFLCGVDPEYMNFLEGQVVAAVRSAEKKLQPAAVRIGKTTVPELLHDGREPYVLHDELVVLQFLNEQKQPFGLFVEWNVHPELLGSKNTLLSADHVGYTVNYLKQKHNCDVAYFTGTVGGLMTSLKVPLKTEAGKELQDGTFEKTERYGLLLGQAVDRALAGVKDISLTPLEVKHRPLFLPMQNKLYVIARTMGVLKREAFLWTGDVNKAEPADAKEGNKPLCIRTEVALLRLGELEVACIPGEIYPELVLGKVQDPVDPGADFPQAAIEPAIYAQLKATHKMIIGLANDEIGYILPKRQWDEKPPFCYGRKKDQYGEENSIGPDAGPLLCTAFAELLGKATDKPNAAPPAAIGDKIPNIRFKDIRFLNRSLEDFRDKRAFVLVFTTTTCPLVQRYLPTLRAMEKEYRSKGVQFLAVNVGPEDGIIDLATQMVEHEMEFPFVKDVDGKCSTTLGVERTPEVVVLDGERRLHYRGRIDDQYRHGGSLPRPTRQDLKEALDAVLAGRPVPATEAPVDGCLITTAAPLTPRRDVTFTEHVQPLLRKHCQECHRPGTPAPFSLITYDEVAGKARMIGEVVRDQRMPPWYASPKHGQFANRRGLTRDERDTILSWIETDKQVGDVSKLLAGPPPQATIGWRIPTPDLVWTSEEFDIPAEGEIAYKYPVLDWKFPEDTYVQGIEIVADNPRVVHHANLLCFTAGGSVRDARLLTGTVPGGDPMWLDDGHACRIGKDSALLLQTHFVTTGKPERCRLRVGIRYPRDVVQKQLRYVRTVDSRFAIPPGEPAFRTRAERVIDRDAVGLGLFAHMHLRGRDMTFRAHYPDGTSETLLMVPNYNFDWLIGYRWEQGKKRFPKGTRIENIAHFDNSSFNAFNPDPLARVRDGLGTRDEMAHGYLFWFDEHEKLNLRVDARTGQAAK
jgi:peroxiredoxin